MEAQAEASCSGRTAVPHAERAWAWFNSIGAPKYHVAPMVDQSELPFRLVCRRNGSTCAYTPMLHARIFSQDQKYRDEAWHTTPEDRPLFVQFCANDPTYLVRAAKMVEPYCDAVDINFGCPQRIAKRGNYGSFLMDDLPLVEKLVKELSKALTIPVTCKIRIFPDLDQTLAYAKMIEAAGCCLLAVHGRTRAQKDNSATRADWDAIRAVKQALSIPVLGNGNVRHLHDAQALMAYTGVEGVLSAESLLVDPALFAPRRLTHEGAYSHMDAVPLAWQYLQLVAQYPVPMRMVRGHVHSILGAWLSEYTHIRDRFNVPRPKLEEYMEAVEELGREIAASGRVEPVPRLSAKELAALEKEAAKKAAIEEQEREEEALQAIEAREAGKSKSNDDDDAEVICDWSECGANGFEGLWAAASVAHAEKAAA